MRTANDFAGIDIKEVWDYRLSSAVPQIMRNGGTWVVELWSKDNEGESEPLETYDTGIIAEMGDEYDVAKIKPCFVWMDTVRDKYALSNIEELKPLVAEVNAVTAAEVAKQSGLDEAVNSGQSFQALQDAKGRSN